MPSTYNTFKIYYCATEVVLRFFTDKRVCNWDTFYEHDMLKVWIILDYQEDNFHPNKVLNNFPIALLLGDITYIIFEAIFSKNKF